MRIKWPLLISSIFWFSIAHGQLKLPIIFTDSLVLQQNMEIPIWGISCSNCKVKVAFNGSIKMTTADKKGTWKIKWPPTKAGGPFTLKVSDKNNSIFLKDILVGEVWLCSGQSNMEFTLAQSKNGYEEIKEAKYSQIRFFRMIPNVQARPLAKVVFSDSLLKELDADKFYDKTSWRTCTPSTAAKFSAVGYYFGKELYQKLDVPIGLICNAVGGATTQSFIDSATLASHPQLVQFVGNKDGKTWLETAKDIHPWVIERTKENLGKNAKSKAFIHPFAPTFLFKNGIEPIANYAIKGAIWYQGESNATHPEIHDALFTALVNNWRKAWQQGNFPIYMVQLPGISNRSRWPEFRESQKRLGERIEKVAMAVIIDIGDSLDVHPKEKKTVGERLSLIALAKTYAFNLSYSGPVLEKYEIKSNKVYLYFNHANQLKPKSGNEIKGFSLVGYNKAGTEELIVEVEKITINGTTITLEIPSYLQLTRINYGWLPFPSCNLVNESDLPGSPFKIEVKGNF